MVRSLALALLALFTVALALASTLPLLPVDVWWVRVLAFPRVLLLVGFLIATAATIALARGRAWGWFVGAGSLVAAALHLVQLAPYLPGPRPGAGCGDDASVSVMVANVQLANAPTDTLLAQVRAVDPDLFFVMETDEDWDRALAALSDRYPHQLQEITGGYYGLHLFSKHPLRAGQVRHAVTPSTPSVEAVVAMPQGDVHFVGVHPRPPLPGQSSAMRDDELLAAARRAASNELPSIVAGDFNAVPWENTMERMRTEGGLVDPREHLGYQATYKAGTWWERWPLDHVLHDDALVVVDGATHAPFGSDHLAWHVELCADDDGVAGTD